MKVLFTSDWQLDWEKLDLGRSVVEEILALKEKVGFSCLVHAGDWKHTYNPTDGRVTNFSIKAIERFRKAGLRVIICLGNHDRFGLYTNANWFPVLRKAGAEAYDDPTIVSFHGGYEIRVLPFRDSPVLVKREADDLSAGADKKRSVLVFHSDLTGARYNVLARSEEGIQSKDLHPGKYLYCVGGHIHLQQRVGGNVWYVGSPFCTDWGEANQPKGYLVLEFETGKLRRVRSQIPGWYDPGWPGFEEAKPRSWVGTRVRVKVPCTEVTQIGEALRRAREKAEKKYEGAEVICIPEIVDGERGEVRIRAEDPDRRKLEVYVSETLPKELRQYKEKVLAYLTEQLQQETMMAADRKLKFEAVKAENFLSFKELKLVLEPGLCVITGKNKDWRRSNGAGKSSSLAGIAVALFGTTFKGQKHDRWMRRGTKQKERSYAKVMFRDAQGREVIVKRSRQPKQLRVFVNGEPVESGNRPEATQRIIERLVGYSWETFSNAVYIEQGRAHVLLTGTESDRKDFLARLQNLERFERAGKRVKEKKAGLEERLNQLQEGIARDLTDAKNVNHTISQMNAVLAPAGNPGAAWEAAKKEKQLAGEKLEEWERMAEQERRSLEKQEQEENTRKEELGKQLAVLEAEATVLESRIWRLAKLKGICPHCQQLVREEHRVRMEMEAIAEVEKKGKVALGLARELGQREAKKKEIQKEGRKWKQNRELEEKVEKWERVVVRRKTEWQQYRKQRELLEQLQERVAQAEGAAREKERKAERVRKWSSVVAYAERVFARNGLPAFLNAQICPELNEEARKYAELFAQGEIQVRFAVDGEGRMDIQVINAHGGEKVQDQSGGELKIASLITSFAVRAAAPKTNLLILDEPGDGLDAVSARQFAKGLTEVVKDFGTVLCVTHNSHVLAELEGRRQIVIVKENGVSRVLNETS